MKIIKFVFFLVGLVSAAASQEYRLRETPDQSILHDHQGLNVSTYAEGLVNVPTENIHLVFMGNEPVFIDHLYYLYYNGDDLIVKDEAQRLAFLDAMTKKLEKFQNDRNRLYKRTLDSQNQLNEARNKKASMLSGISSLLGRGGAVDIEPLEAAYNANLNELEMLDKKLLKLKAFYDYCTNSHRIKLQSEKIAESQNNSQTITGKFRNFFGLQNENDSGNRPNTLTVRSKKN